MAREGYDTIQGKGNVAYDTGREIAEEYVKFYGRDEMEEGFKHLSSLLNIRPTKTMEPLYRKIDQKDIGRARDGFYKFFTELKIVKGVSQTVLEKRKADLTKEEEDLCARRNQASLKFHSDWVLATATKGGFKEKKD